MAVRAAGTVFAVAVNETVPFPEPDAGTIVHHDGWLLATVHVALHVILNVFVFAAEFIWKLFCETANVALGLCCVTVTVCVFVPAVTVIVAVRGAFVAFAVVAILTVPLPVPDAGETVHHDWLLTAVQFPVLVTVRELFPAVDDSENAF
jgi:hypothetical protein